MANSDLCSLFSAYPYASFRAFLYMLIEPDISYDLLLSMCDLVYLILTRGIPPIEDLLAVSHVLLVTSSARFQKLYVEGMIANGGAGRPVSHDHPSAQARSIRLKVIRRGLLRLMIKVRRLHITCCILFHVERLTLASPPQQS